MFKHEEIVRFRSFSLMVSYEPPNFQYCMGKKKQPILAWGIYEVWDRCDIDINIIVPQTLEKGEAFCRRDSEEWHGCLALVLYG